MDDARALLDELMGKERNVALQQRRNKDAHFADPDVCKFYICGFCPHELFINTKSDLGPCNKIHDDHFKKMFEQAKNKEDYPYQREFACYLQKLVEDLDRRIKKGHERLDTDDRTDVPLTTENREKVLAISEKIQVLLNKIEELGEEGKVDECQKLMKEADRLKLEKEQIIQSNDIRSNSAQEKRMKVCEVCGAFLVVGDTEKRISSHMDGKQHQGYALIRKTLADLKVEHPELDFRRSDRDDRDRRSRSRDRPRSRDYDSYRRRERSRERDRDARDRKRTRF